MAREKLLPRARRRALIVREVSGETLVYDEARHKAHCLNEAATLVWRCCDGQTSSTEAARRLQERVDAANEDAVWLAIRQLEKARLLEHSTAAGERTAGLSRREVARKLGITVLALPLVSSVLAPTAAQAATCVPCGQPCNIITDTCCAPCSCIAVLGCQ